MGAYTSPHLLRYNERVRVCGRAASDTALCEAFARVEAERGDITLTYFEFGTLAALAQFAEAGLDVLLLEVGLGGRLDAVNAVPPDVAVVTTIACDHEAWLGRGREAVAAEKAGIFRAHRPAVCGDGDPPAALDETARRLGAPLYRLQREFGFERTPGGWHWWRKGDGRSTAFGTALHELVLPLPGLQGGFQVQNAATALMALDLLDGLPVEADAARRGLQDVRLPGRLQRIPGPVERVLDVAHNPQAAKALAEALQSQPVPGRTLAVLGILADKDIEGVLHAVRGVVDAWYVAPPDTPRAASGTALAEALDRCRVQVPVEVHADIAATMRAAQRAARAGDRIVVFGSFYTVAKALQVGV